MAMAYSGRNPLGSRILFSVPTATGWFKYRITNPTTQLPRPRPVSYTHLDVYKRQVSVLSGPAPECASIIQGTIAAAAVINEIIAVFMAKKGFEWAGELHQAKEDINQ